MSAPVKNASKRASAGQQPGDIAVLRAEHDYHDCMARFGHDSAEAHAAGVVWRHLRQRQTHIGGTSR